MFKITYTDPAGASHVATTDSSLTAGELAVWLSSPVLCGPKEVRVYQADTDITWSYVDGRFAGEVKSDE